MLVRRMASSAATATRIDGSYLEGGGQVLRNAIAYSALLKKPIVVENIRGNRDPPGLRPQHATGLELVSRLSKNSVLTGAKRGSSEVEFQPGNLVSGSLMADTKTAGSTTLLLQVSLPCLLFSARPATDDRRESELKLRGGTNATKAPPIDFVNFVLFPFLERHFGFAPKLVIRKRGYYPKGQGEICIENIPCLTKTLPSITVTNRGQVTLIRGRAYVAGTLPPHLVRTMANAARKQLQQAGYGGRMVDIDEEIEPPKAAAGSGSGIILWAETDQGCIISGSAIGERGVKADETGRDAAQELIENLAHGGCVDEYLQDQIIIFMALAEGQSRIVCGPLSLHTQTAIWLAGLMTGAKFTITEEGDGKVDILCQGIGLRPPPTIGVDTSEEN